MIIDKTPAKKAKSNGGYIAIPKVVFSSAYNTVSAEAKLLYGILLDRTSLSERKPEDWKTKDGEIFVYYPLTQISEILGCGHDKATRLLRELSDAGLILRIRQGLGRPDQIVVKTALQNDENKHSTLRESTKPGCDISACNNTDVNNTESNYLDLPLLHNRAAMEMQIQENINYELLISQQDQKLVDYIIHVMVDALCRPGSTVNIAGADRDKMDIYRRFMEVNEVHIQYIIRILNTGRSEIRAVKPYILALLLRVDAEMDIYYGSLVAADEEKSRSNVYGTSQYK